MARFVSTLSLGVSIVALYYAFPVLRWLNRIENAAAPAEMWERKFSIAFTVLGCVAFGIALAGRKLPSTTFHLASTVAIMTLCVMLFPFVGWFLAVFFYSYVLILPTAFYGAAVVRSTIDAWWQKGESGTAAAAGLSALGFSCCIYSALFFDKAMALGWAVGMD